MKEKEKRQVPDVALLKDELKREKYKHQYAGTLRSTFSQADTSECHSDSTIRPARPSRCGRCCERGIWTIP